MNLNFWKIAFSILITILVVTIITLIYGSIEKNTNLKTSSAGYLSNTACALIVLYIFYCIYHPKNSETNSETNSDTNIKSST
jgi:hypothetical protein